VVTPPMMAGHPSRIDSLTGLRGLAALWVLGFHAFVIAGMPTSGSLWPLREVLHSGWLGVDVFFVLSGFLLTRNLLIEDKRDHRVSWTAFFLARAARLLPAYYAQLALLAGLGVFIASPLVWSPTGAGEVLAHGLLWLNAWPWVGAHVSPWWSLSVEAMFYVSMPMLWLALRRGPSAAFALFAAAMLLSVAWRAGLAQSVESIEWRIGWAEHAPGRLVQFSVGAMVAVWLPSLRSKLSLLPAPWGDVALILSAVLLCGLPWWMGSTPYGGVVDARPFTWFWPSLTALPAACLVVLLATDAAHGTARVLASAPLRGLGVISFGLYLWHYPIQWAMRSALGGYVPESFGLGAFLALSALFAIVAATISWWVVERPALGAASRLRVRISAPKRSPL
jgi:peptidoglycan/LPS O-acetylase OafA/YrhL